MQAYCDAFIYACNCMGCPEFLSAEAGTFKIIIMQIAVDLYAQGSPSSIRSPAG